MKTTRKCLLMFLAVLMAAALCACGKQQVDLSPYMSIEYQGVNGKAQAVLNIDYSDFEYEIMQQWDDKDKDFDHLAKLTELESSVQIRLSKDKNLSNGDQVEATVTFDQERAANLGLKITGTKKSFTVEGLAEAQLVDPFAGAVFGEGRENDFHLEGISPNLRLKMDDEVDGICYQADKTENIANGDVITVKAYFKNPGEVMRVLSRNELQVTVADYPGYLEDFSQIKQADLEKLQEAGEKAVIEYADWMFKMELQEVADQATKDSMLNCPIFFQYYDGFCFDDGAFINTNNGSNRRLDKLILPFSFDVHGISWSYDEEDREIDTRRVYGYMAFSYIIVDADGNLMAAPGEKPFLKIQDTMYESWDRMVERACKERADLW